MKKFKTGILVRDNLVDKMTSWGIKVNYKTLNDEEYDQCLRNKMIEEATELAQETDRIKIVEEMADVKEVFTFLKRLYDVTDEELEEVSAEKRKNHGSFEKRHFTNFVEIEDGSSEADYYLERPEKYPQI